MSVWQSVSMHQRFRQLPSAFFTPVRPTPLEHVQWVIWNGVLARRLGLPEQPDDELLKAFSGESLPEQFAPLAMKYAGHQFGVYNPDLGDGRGLLLAEIEDQSGTLFDLHLKGAGQTPYSRMGDGRAVLRSTIREYLCSEAMAGLGIETTRALAMMVSETPVYREKQEKGALLVRAAESHIRFGHFEHFYYTGQTEHLRLLADKAIDWYWPHCRDDAQPYQRLFSEIVDRTAEMIAYWQAYGFAHGVMNTDNMSILGQTFDYGPYAFLDDYEPGFICNHSDYQGRYAFNRQPGIALWNLSALAQAFSPLVDKALLEDALDNFAPQLNSYFSQLMRHKLGIHSKQPDDGQLFADMFELLAANHTDYSRFLRQLSCLDREPEQAVLDLFIDRDAAAVWLRAYLERCELERDENDQLVTIGQRCEQMRSVNPKYILRNYLAQIAIEKAEQGDFSEVERLAGLLTHPYDEQPEYEEYARLPPEWGKKLEISCSS